MAKGKKTADKLSPEEKLRQVLVPAEDQPYPVPENWCWVKLKFVSEIYTGNSISEKTKAEKYMGQKNGLLFIATKDVGFNCQVNYETNVRIPDFTNFKVAPANTALLCIEGGSAGRKVGFVTRNVCFGNKLCAFVAKTVNPRFIFYVLQSQYFIDQFNAKKHGLIGGVSVKDLAEIGFTLPPLPEQQRIVSRIESLFAKLDEAKEKAQSVVDGFELRKSAILHKAFTGELTAKWREEHGVGLESWTHNPWGNFIVSVEAGKNWSAEGRPPEDGEFGVVKVSAVTWGEFDELESKTCTLKEQWNEKTQIHIGDFLFSRANTLQLVGNCVIVKSIGRRLMLSDKILRFRFDKSVIPEYILYFTRSNLYREQIEQLASGNQDGMRNVSQKNMKLIEFYVPSLPEQKEIVCMLDNLLSKDQQAKEAAEAVLAQIDTIKKSILARAFRGELGTNDPAEESAVELVKKVL